MDEFAFGLWYRYFTHYPNRMWAGKNEGVYHICRISNTQQADNQENKLLTFTMLASAYQVLVEAGPAQSYNVPADMEGVWNYIYVSSLRQKKVVSFFKVTDGNFTR